MAKHKRLRVEYPYGGLDRSGPYRQQPPFTTDTCMNVRVYGTAEGRRRGGSRPGLVESHRTDIGSSVRMLHNMQVVLGDGFTAWSDNFDGTSMASAWTQASWSSNQPSILPGALASIDNSVADAASVRDALSIDSSSAYAVETFLVPWDGAWHGSYSLYLRMDNSSPLYTTEGVEVKLTMTGSSGNITAELNSYLASAKTVTDSGSIAFTEASPGWLTVTVSGTTVTVYFQGTQILTGTVDAHSGLRVGIGLECTVDGGLCLMNTFRVQYYSTATVPDSRTLLMGSASGDLWKETFYGVMEQISTNLSLRSDVRISSAQGGQNLYLCDYGLAESGTDGTISGTTLDAASVSDWTGNGANIYDYVAVITAGTGAVTNSTYAISAIAAGSVTLASAPGDGNCSYRVERQIKVYDAEAGTLANLVATAGQIPSGNHLLCRYLDRMLLAGSDLAPNAWYLSAVGAYGDYDYAAEGTDRAVAGPASQAGVPGSPLTAVAPTSDDYAVLFCKDRTYRLRGDPVFGGSLDVLSEVVGCVDSHAWCHGPAAEIIFLSLDGLYILPSGGNSFPISMSREALPRELKNIDSNIMEVSLAYDIGGRGVHIFLTPEDSNDRIHWWFDWETKTYWPLTLQSDHEPTAICVVQATAIEASGVVLGCKDGMLRTFNDLANNDCGTAFSSYVVLGPIALATDGDAGNVLTVDTTLSAESGPVTYEIAAAETWEGASSATAYCTGTWTSGLNATVRPSVRGQAFTCKLTGTAHRHFQFEGAVAIVKAAGRRRIS